MACSSVTATALLPSLLSSGLRVSKGNPSVVNQSPRLSLSAKERHVTSRSSEIACEGSHLRPFRVVRGPSRRAAQRLARHVGACAADGDEGSELAHSNQEVGHSLQRLPPGGQDTALQVVPRSAPRALALFPVGHSAARHLAAPETPPAPGQQPPAPLQTLGKEEAWGLVLQAVMGTGWTTGSGLEGPSAERAESGAARWRLGAGGDDAWTLSKSPRRRTAVKFTCNKCGARTVRAINRHAYEAGTVFVQCKGCNVYHKLVDHLGLFHELQGPVFGSGGGTDPDDAPHVPYDPFAFGSADFPLPPL